MKCFGAVTVLFLTVTVVSCCTRQPVSRAADNSGAAYRVYVINRGIHTGLVVPVSDHSIKLIPALGRFNRAQYVDFGWGDEEVYQSNDETWCMDARAVLVPSSSVMRAEVYPGDPVELSSWSDYSVEFGLSEEQFNSLCAYIDSSFSRDDKGSLVETSSRSGGDIIYFRSTRTYCGLNTCNTWVASALASAGLDVSSFLILTKSGLFDEISGHGRVLKKR